MSSDAVSPEPFHAARAIEFVNEQRPVVGVEIGALFALQLGDIGAGEQGHQNDNPQNQIKIGAGRQKILQQIAELKQYYQTDEDLVSTLQSIERQVIGWRLAKRILTPVDYDLARIQPQYNPRFDEGHYLLQLKLRRTAATETVPDDPPPIRLST